jgi:hypothetical protein
MPQSVGLMQSGSSSSNDQSDFPSTNGSAVCTSVCVTSLTLCTFNN